MKPGDKNEEMNRQTSSLLQSAIELIKTAMSYSLLSSGWHWDEEQDAYCIGSGCSWDPSNEGNNNDGNNDNNNNDED